MKNLVTALMTGVLVFALASCGNDNASSDKKSSSSNNDGGISSNGTNFGSYSKVRDTFTKMSMASGLKRNDVIYHIGPDYGAQTNNGNFEFDSSFNFCIDIGFWSAGDCEQYQQPQGGQLDYLVANGEYKVAKEMEKNRVDYDLAVGVINGMFDFEFSIFDRDDVMYRKMLNLDKKRTAKVVVSKADILIDNNKKVMGDYVEYFFEDGSYEGYVLSNSFPLMANPLFNLKDYQITGALNFAGPKTVRRISVMTHYLEYDPRKNRYEVRDRGQASMQF